MTVKELKEQLDKFDDNLIVLICNYRGAVHLRNVSQGTNEFDGLLFLDDYEEDDE